jgi:hypothetical protein
VPVAAVANKRMEAEDLNSQLLSGPPEVPLASASGIYASHNVTFPNDDEGQPFQAAGYNRLDSLTHISPKLSKTCILESFEDVHADVLGNWKPQQELKCPVDTINGEFLDSPNPRKSRRKYYR